MGGSSGGFSPVSDAEVYPGLTNCGAAADVIWLSENPESGSVAPDTGTQNVDVTLDATAINQPGDYTAHIKIRTAYSIPDVQVTMHVPLPLTWGTLSGTVEGLGRCDAPGAPLSKATVYVDNATGLDWTLETDSNGNYTVSFPIADGPATITVSRNGYVDQSISGISVNHNTVTDSDFQLRLDAPCGDKTPTSFEVSLDSGETTTLPFTLSNAGAGGMDYTIRETLFPLDPLRPQLTKAKAPRLPRIVQIGPKSVRSMKSKATVKTNAPQDPKAWFLGLPLPGGLVRYAHAQCDDSPNSFYIFGGVDGNFDSVTNAWRFDAETDTWNDLAPMPAGAEGPAATCYQGRIYVLGGDGSTQHFIYDIASDTWFNGSLLPRPVWGATVGSWNGKVYMIGGDDDFSFGGTSDEVNVYDISSDTWEANATSMPIPTGASGYFQAGPMLYIVGGWDDSSPDVNVAATQRYDMSADEWTQGPDLGSPRADLALGMTDTALYAMGGDADGGSPFDSSDTVERMEWAEWPDGFWEEVNPLPTARTSNNAGFCTNAIAAGSEVWSVAGLSENFEIEGNNYFQTSNTEHCYSIFSDVSWLSESPDAGSVAGDDSGSVDINFDATGLDDGDYTAVLVVRTNDPGASQFNIPVTLHVGGGGPGGCLFCDDFDDASIDPDWTIVKGTWTEPAAGLTGTAPRKATIVATGFTGCQVCTLDAEVQSAGGAGNKLWVLGWFVDKNNTVELLIKQETGKVILRQRSGGVIVAKKSASAGTILPNTVHSVSVDFDGTQFSVSVDGTPLFTMSPAAAVPTGTVGFAVKGTVGTFGMIDVN